MRKLILLQKVFATDIVVMVMIMANWKITFKPLFKLLLDRNLSKGDLCEMAQISRSSITKMANDELVKLDVIIKICEALDIDITQVMQLVSADGAPVKHKK